MIVTLSGITGIGKSYYKNLIVKEFGFKNLVITTTRKRRYNEKNNIDKIFVSNEEFNKLKQENKIFVDFEFLGYKYAYSAQALQSDENQVTELHYSTIYEFKKNAKDVFSIYILPSSVERAKKELHKRNLPEKVEKARLQEINEHIKEFSHNKKLQAQFDYVFINNYDKESKEKLLNIIREKLKQDTKVLLNK